MSHQGHIPHGHPIHVNQPPHINLPKAPEYKPVADTGEGKTVGRIAGKLIGWLVFGSAWLSALSAATVFDLLRMQSAPEGYLSGRRMIMMWAGLLTYLLWGTGVFGSIFLTAFYFFAAMTPLVGALNALLMIGSPALVLNSLLSPFVPLVAVRLSLMTAVFNTSGSSMAGNRILGLKGLAAPVVGGYSLLDLHFYVDCFSILIPVVLTVLATIKWVKLSREGSGGMGSQVSATAWSGVQKGFLALGAIAVLLGLPGAPAGQWVLMGLFAWVLRGVTKTATAEGSDDRKPVKDGDGSNPSRPTGPASSPDGRQAAGPYDVEVQQ
jgi:hypothetical protein